MFRMNQHLPPRRKWLLLCLWLCGISLWATGCFLEPVSLDGYPCADNQECPGKESCYKGKCYLNPPTNKPGTCSSVTDCQCGSTCNTSKKCEPIATCASDNDCRLNSACQWYCNTTTQKCQATKPPPPPECTKDDECKACDTSCDKARGICRIITCKGDSDCRCGFFCHDDGRCRKDAPPKQCNSPEDCESRRCFDGKCLGPCSANSDCSNGRVCRNQRCERPTEGEPCDSKIGCEGDALCIDEDGKATCRKLCHPLNKNECVSPKVCVFLERSVQGQPLGVCRSQVQGKKLGEVCSDSLPCTTGLYCVSDGQKKACRTLCSPSASPSECPTGEQCVKVFSGQSNVGVCMKATCETIPNFCKPGNVCYQGTCRRSCKTDSCSSAQFCSEKNPTVSICEEKACNYSGKVCDLTSACSLFECKKLSNPPKTCTSDSSCSSPQKCGIFKAGFRSVSSCFNTCKITEVDACKKQGLSNHLCVPYPAKTSGGTVTNFCMPRRGGGGIGATCSQLKPCEWDHVCIDLTTRSSCLKLCDPKYKTNNVSCPSKHSCLPLRSFNLGVCVNETPRDTGQPCGVVEGSCKAENICVLLRGETVGKCRKECKMLGLNCKSSERCVQLSGSTKSVCIPK